MMKGFPPRAFNVSLLSYTEGGNRGVNGAVLAANGKITFIPYNRKGIPVFIRKLHV